MPISRLGLLVSEVGRLRASKLAGGRGLSAPTDWIAKPRKKADVMKVLSEVQDISDPPNLPGGGLFCESCNYRARRRRTELWATPGPPRHTRAALLARLRREVHLLKAGLKARVLSQAIVMRIPPYPDKLVVASIAAFSFPPERRMIFRHSSAASSSMPWCS